MTATGPTAALDRLAEEQTRRVLTAQATLAELVMVHDLRIMEASCAAGARQLLLDTDGRIRSHRWLGPPAITLRAAPGDFLAWCELLQVSQVRLRRELCDIWASHDPVVHIGHQWLARTNIVRSKTCQPAADLPGDPVPWQSDRARIGRQRLAHALTVRGLA